MHISTVFDFTAIYLNFPDSTESKAFLYCLLDLLYSETICLACNIDHLSFKVCSLQNLVTHLVRLRPREGHCGGGETSVDGPGVLTRPAPAPEVILTLKLPLPLLLRHDSVVVAVVVKDLLA